MPRNPKIVKSRLTIKFENMQDIDFTNEMLEKVLGGANAQVFSFTNGYADDIIDDRDDQDQDSNCACGCGCNEGAGSGAGSGN